MRRRLPSPALVVASVAVFVALSGAGLAAGLALVWSPRSNVLLAADVSADGRVTGAALTGGRVSAGVYTLTVRGDTFGHAAGDRHLRDKVEAVLFTAPGEKANPAQCAIASEQLASDGGATAEIDCFRFDPKAGWQPSDSAFDVQMVGPGR